MAAPPWTAANGPMDFATLRHLYRARQQTPADLVAAVHRRIRASDLPNVWIALVDERIAVDQALALEKTAQARGMAEFPLYGIPFAVKDNIDVAGMMTTAACRDFAYRPAASSPVVEKLLAAGAILIGKTNLDQFATGLTGLLSSFGPTRNPFNPAFISGGSSSGSAIALAAGLVSFALGTDTAGSGRVPAAFNNLVGIKATPGLISTRGVFPACRSLDCLSLLALNVQDASELMALAKGFDPQDPYSRPDASDFDPSMLQLPVSRFRMGVPAPGQLEFLGDPEARSLYQAAVARLEKLGGRRTEIDLSPFLDAGKLLYDGPWVAQRLASIDAFHAAHPESLTPATCAIMDRGRLPSALDAFKAMDKLARLRAVAAAQWALMDVLVLPTAPRAFTIQEAAPDPAAASAKLGLYTNFVNLMDLAAVALPAGFTSQGMPFGISLIGRRLSDANLIALGQRFFPARSGGLLGAPPLAHPEPPTDADEPTLPESERPRQTLLCVVGAHLSGQPLNHQLIGLDATLVKRTRTAPHYRLFALSGTTPPKPGLLRVPDGDNNGPGAQAGCAIAVEVWSLPERNVGAFLARIAPPLCIGNVQLENGQWVKGFLCETIALTGAQDISKFGGWVPYLAAAANHSAPRAAAAH